MLVLGLGVAASSCPTQNKIALSLFGVNEGSFMIFQLHVTWNQQLLWDINLQKFMQDKCLRIALYFRA